MKQLLILLVALTIFSCSKNNEPAAGLKLAGTTWVVKYSTDQQTKETLYMRYRFTTDKDVVHEAYYQVSKIISSVDHTYKYDPPKLLLTHDGSTYRVEVVGDKIKSGQLEYIRQ